MLKSLCLCVTLAALLTACAGGPALTAPVQLLDVGSHSGITEPTYVLIRNGAQFVALWRRVYAEHTPVPPVPEVDWSRQMVVAGFLGTRSHGGYEVSVAAAGEEGSRYRVVFQVSTPGVGCHTTEALTQPYVIAALPASLKPLQPELQEVHRAPCDRL